MRFERLIQLLELARPHGGEGERKVVEFLAPYKPTILFNKADVAMAYTIKVGASETLFSAHLDTAEAADGQHTLVFKDGIISTDGDSILGADDGAGIWLLLEMIDAQVPGTYCFTVGEEHGGVGAKFVGGHHADFLKQFKRAITFDRRGCDSVITHMFCGRTCSDVFANELADRLNAVLGGNGFYSPDDTGSYTDTAEYIDSINNCTNIGVGYQREHTHDETLDYEHLLRLRDACINIEWETLDDSERPADDPIVAVGMYDGYRSQMSHRESRVNVDNVLDLEYDDMVDWIYSSQADEVACVLWELLWGKPARPGIEEDYEPLESGGRLNVGMF